MTGAELHLFTARWLLSCAKTKRRAVLRSEPAAGEIAIGFVLPLQGHEAGRQLAAEKPVIEKIERPIQRGIGLCGWIGGGHGGLFCIVRNNNRMFCAEKAVGVTAQTIFTQDNFWLWWMPAVVWLGCGIYAVAGVKT